MHLRYQFYNRKLFFIVMCLGIICRVFKREQDCFDIKD